MGFAHPGAFPVLPDAIEACAQAGDLARAESLLARLEREAAHVGSVSACAGAVRGRGVVLLASGAAEDAAAALEDACDAFAGIGFLLDAARARLAQGSALLRDGRRSLAAEVLADARDRFAATGASLWEARAAAELDRAAPGRAPVSSPRPSDTLPALVADGLKNREIAARLFMGLATVEAHLTRIYRKLGIRSRSELVRLVADGAVAVSGARRAARIGHVGPRIEGFPASRRAGARRSVARDGRDAWNGRGAARADADGGGRRPAVGSGRRPGARTRRRGADGAPTGAPPAIGTSRLDGCERARAPCAPAGLSGAAVARRTDP